VVRGPSGDDATTYYGPFVGAHRVADAVRELNDALGLRDCRTEQRMIFADQRELFQLTPRTPGCIRHEIHKCLGPCVGACTVAEYDRQVAMARAFLDGLDTSPIVVLREQMEAASAALQFERAASLRDKLARLEALRDQFKQLRFAVETLSFVYTVPGIGGPDKAYIIRRGVVRGEMDAPRSRQDHATLRRMVDDIFGVHEPVTASVPTHEIDELLLLSSWFRKFPDELQRATQGKLSRRPRPTRPTPAPPIS
jgi:excinuclease ABC subunit C